MNSNNLPFHLTGKSFAKRFRSLLLVVPMLLAAYTLTGAVSPALAHGNDDKHDGRGSVSVTAASATAAPDSVLTFTLTVHNGNQAGWVTVTDTLPRYTNLVFASGCMSNANGDLTCSFFMAPDGVASTTIMVYVDPQANCHAHLVNTARVRGWDHSDAEVDVACVAP